MVFTIYCFAAGLMDFFSKLIINFLRSEAISGPGIWWDTCRGTHAVMRESIGRFSGSDLKASPFSYFLKIAKEARVGTPPSTFQFYGGGPVL